ncbi:MAG: BolA/IbaG family iron-sulfur metabolism protein [Gammaproteobacteria bacterium]|nr:BolA/IbaG family iron-sulfur metabolism protein [Gammaproteobacteria bacterium]
MTPQEIQQLIEAKMTGAKVSVSGEEGKFTAEVISNQFEDLMIIKRHKLVYACVKDEITSGALHALTIVAKTPAEVA